MKFSRNFVLRSEPVGLLWCKLAQAHVLIGLKSTKKTNYKKEIIKKEDKSQFPRILLAITCIKRFYQGQKVQMICSTIFRRSFYS